MIRLFHKTYTTERRKIRSAGREMELLLFRPASVPGRSAAPESSEHKSGSLAGEGQKAAAGSVRPPGVLWIHGGGYITGMARMIYISRALPLVRKYGAVVAVPEYRLAREAPYPAALDDCYAALLYLKDRADELGIDGSRIMVGGESAGGGLTAALCMLARDRGEVRVAFQMPLYPMLDDRDTPSSCDHHGLVWNTRLNHKGWSAYLGRLRGKEVPPYAAAARQTDYTGLPPAYTFIGTREPFFCETVAYIDRLRDAGVEARMDIYETGVHAFDMLLPCRRISREAAEKFEQNYLYAAEHYRAEQSDSHGNEKECAGRPADGDGLLREKQ